MSRIDTDKFRADFGRSFGTFCHSMGKNDARMASTRGKVARAALLDDLYRSIAEELAALGTQMKGKTLSEKHAAYIVSKSAYATTHLLTHDKVVIPYLGMKTNFFHQRPKKEQRRLMTMKSKRKEAKANRRAMAKATKA